jgi:hypothetical protein
LAHQAKGKDYASKASGKYAKRAGTMRNEDMEEQEMEESGHKAGVDLKDRKSLEAILGCKAVRVTALTALYFWLINLKFPYKSSNMFHAVLFEVYPDKIIF